MTLILVPRIQSIHLLLIHLYFVLRLQRCLLSAQFAYSPVGDDVQSLTATPKQETLEWQPHALGR